jgi:hypothetical protein
LCGEDTSFGEMAKKIMGDNFVQYCVKNVLRVHNRRHPRKRTGVLGEDNPRGVQDKKGSWWGILEYASKENLDNLHKQKNFNRVEKILMK